MKQSTASGIQNETQNVVPTVTNSLMMSSIGRPPLSVVKIMCVNWRCLILWYIWTKIQFPFVQTTTKANLTGNGRQDVAAFLLYVCFRQDSTIETVSNLRISIINLKKKKKRLVKFYVQRFIYSSHAHTIKVKNRFFPCLS